MSTDIVNQFQQTVCKYGDQTALTWKDENLTFHEIDRQSDLVAGYLVSRGYISTHVGCYMKRTALWPIALLGLLKARCSYTPLDLANPKSRIQDIIDDADIGFVITDETCLMDFGDVPSKDPDRHANDCSRRSRLYLLYLRHYWTSERHSCHTSATEPCALLLDAKCISCFSR